MYASQRTVSFAFLVLIAACSSSGGDSGSQKCGPDTEPCTAPPYADTEWTTIHATSRNNDYVETTIAQRYETKWKALEGVATLMGPSIGPEGNLYITTPAFKDTPALHALDSDGNLLWQSDPWADGEGLDSCAGYNTPIVDTEGDVYVSDCNQVWSFTATGELRWVVDLPPAPEGAVWQDIAAAPLNSFVTAMFTKEGAVGGITVWGDVVLLSRETGEPVAEPFKMPGSVAVTELPTGPGIEPPPGVWDGTMDPDMISPVWYIFDGVTPGANTPAVHPETGRIYNTGFSSDTEDDLGAMYAFNFVLGANGGLGRVEVDFEYVMGPGSGSSPGIGPNGGIVYVSDGEGILHSVNAATGAKNWELETTGRPASPSVGPDGKVYLLGGTAGSAVNPNGTLAWQANLDELAATLVPPPDPDSTLSGPTTFNNAIPTVTDSGILTSVTVGYSAEVAGRTDVPVAVMQIVVLLDADTGEPVPGHEFLEADDSIEGFVIPSLQGNVYVNQGTLASTIAVGPVGPIFEAELPDGVELLEPIGGLQAFAPAQ